MPDPIPEQVYRDAATAHVRTEGVNDGYIEDQIGDPPFRAAVESAYRAGAAAAAPHIAAKALRDIAAEDGGSLLATAWVLRRADDIERAARAAGKDKTDGDH